MQVVKGLLRCQTSLHSHERCLWSDTWYAASSALTCWCSQSRACLAGHFVLWDHRRILALAVLDTPQSLRQMLRHWNVLTPTMRGFHGFALCTPYRFNSRTHVAHLQVKDVSKLARQTDIKCHNIQQSVHHFHGNISRLQLTIEGDSNTKCKLVVHLLWPTLGIMVRRFHRTEV